MPRVGSDPLVYEDTTSRKRCRDIQDILSDAGTAVDKYSAIVYLMEKNHAADWNARAQKLQRQVGGVAPTLVSDLLRSLPKGLAPAGSSVPVDFLPLQVSQQHAAPSTSMSSAAAGPPAAFDAPKISEFAAVTKPEHNPALGFRSYHEAQLAQKIAVDKELVQDGRFPFRVASW